MKRILIILLCVLAVRALHATDPSEVRFDAELLNTAGAGDFAPYYFTANRFGTLTQSANVLLDLRGVKTIDKSRRFSWGAGIEALGGWSEKTLYSHFTPTQGWVERDLNGSHANLQQLYGEVKFRGVFLTAGMKQRGSALLDNELSSGDLTQSANARPLPEVRMGFIDFQNIPFTQGWVQIQGEVGYGRYTDFNWLEDHFNTYTGHIVKGSINNYKRCYFRTRPAERFSVTVGAQCVTVFGGTRYQYERGEVVETRKFSKSLRSFVEAFLPVSKGLEDFRLGNTLGSWDLMARYTLPKDAGEVKAYFQWPWEDGSGIGRRNGFDGLWGVQYTRHTAGWLTNVVVEYLDLTNQSGPLHWAPGDRPGTTITGEATGADDYYNNAYYNSYANYGMAMGSPFVKSPLFNLDGYPAFANTRMRGGHLAVSGAPDSRLSYRAMISYRKAWGNGYIPVAKSLHSTSVMIEASYRLPQVNGLAVKAAFGLDHGTLLGNNSGGLLSLSYTFGVKINKNQ